MHCIQAKTANPEEGRDALSSKLETTLYFQLLASCGMRPDVSACLFRAVFYNFLVETMAILFFENSLRTFLLVICL